MIVAVVTVHNATCTDNHVCTTLCGGAPSTNQHDVETTHPDSSEIKTQKSYQQCLQ